MSSVNTKGDVEQQRTEEPAGRGTRKTLVVIALLLFLAIGIGVGIGIGAGIWKDGSTTTTSSSLSQADLEALFQRLDGNQDGSVSVDELVADVAARGNVSLNATEAQKTLSLLDSDGDGVVGRDEFMNSADDQTVESGLGNLLEGCDWSGDDCYACKMACPCRLVVKAGGCPEISEANKKCREECESDPDAFPYLEYKTAPGYVCSDMVSTPISIGDCVANFF